MRLTRMSEVAVSKPVAADAKQTPLAKSLMV